MTSNCAWCKKALEIDTDADVLVHPVSHGICRDCARKMFAEFTEPMQVFLNRFEIPILVIDAAENVITANSRAKKRAGLEDSDLKGMRCGDVLHCIHAIEPGGCGRTIHCQSCVIRNSVLHTFKTGEPLLQVPAYPDLQQFDDNHEKMFLISTEKIGETVFLKIEEIPVLPAV
jgi:PAS domain-containing protein